jgi:hypothetical protein
MRPAPQDNQLVSKHRVLSFKPQLRLEWRGQDGQSETEQPDHSASLGDSVTSSTRIRFSVHTGHDCAGTHISGHSLERDGFLRQGLRRRPKTRSIRRHQARLPAPVRRRTRHWSSQERDRMGRNHLAGSRGDAANAVLAAAGYNFRLLFLWVSILCAWFSAAICIIRRP